MFNGLNDQIMLAVKRSAVPKWEARDLAPSTIEDVIKSYNETGKIVVWSGGSSETIYQDAAVNYAFRAWHDFCHIKLQADFSLDGESRVCRHQMSQVGTLVGKVLQIEIVDQVKEFLKTGQFVADQYQFTIDQLKGLNK